MQKSPLVEKNYQELAFKLLHLLKPSGWSTVLKGFILSEDFYQILKTLDNNVQDNKRFTPVLSNVFRAFMECPILELKCIIMAEEPSPVIGISNGIAFSSGNPARRDANATEIFKVLLNTAHKGSGDIKDYDGDLTRWSNQGVLMLNLALTTEIDKPGRHFKLWDPFIKYLIDMLNTHPKKLLWVFMGERVAETEELVDDKHTKILCDHPSTARHSFQKTWQSNDIFSTINVHLTDNNETPIVW